MTKALSTHDDLAHIFFVHSPITYSIAKAAADRLQLANAVLIGARGIEGPDVAHSVCDDGQWSVSACCKLLQLIVEQVPPERGIALYVPHTMFLLGKLIRLSRRVVRLFYLEEGFTSADATWQKCFIQPEPIHQDALLVELMRTGLLRALDIDLQGVRAINSMPVRPFDLDLPQYAGGFACSQDAFPGMRGVARLQFTVDPIVRPAHLISFFGLLNHAKAPKLVNRAYEQMLDIIHPLVNRGQEPQAIVVKLHPRDELAQPQWFRQAIESLGVGYLRYCKEHGLNPNIEPALHNFSHYYFIGKTAQSKYVAQFLGNDRMTQYNNGFNANG